MSEQDSLRPKQRLILKGLPMPGARSLEAILASVAIVRIKAGQHQLLRVAES